MPDAVHIVVFDGYADWEPAMALVELRRSGGFDVVTVGFSGDPVSSMGGLRVLPDRSERQTAVPICGAGQPVVRGFEPPQRNRSLRVFKQRQRYTVWPAPQPCFVNRGPAFAGLACGEYTLVMTQHELVTPCVWPQLANVESPLPPRVHRGGERVG